MTKEVFIPDLTPHFETIRAENEAEERRLELFKLMQDINPFPDELCTPEARKDRIEKSKLEYWYFDKTYFPKEAYKDYFAPSVFHHKLVEITNLKDKCAHIIHGPRGFAKTITFKKKFIYDFLFGRRRLMGVASETMDAPSNYLLDIIEIIETNPRIRHDFELTWYQKSTDNIYARSEVNPKGTFVKPFSELKSTKAAQRMFDRLDFMMITDFENETSSLTKQSVEKRIGRLNEMRTSLTDDGVLIWEGNNFDPDCAMNHLFVEEERGILSPFFKMYKFKAWDESRRFKSLWRSKYPFDKEKEFWDAVKPKDDYDKAGNFQGEPKKKSGEHFPNDYYNEWESLPADTKCVIYTDPNCSLKEKGDTTAITALGWSSSAQQFFIPAARCKSYFDSNELLTDFLQMRKQLSQIVTVIDCAFDGNVTQESSWENNILQFTRQSGFPFPAIQFKKYKVDDLVTPAEAEWKKGKFFFPPNFSKTTEGAEYLKQHFAFKTKKAKKKDDAPDSFISAYQFLIELGIAFVTGSSKPEYHSVSQRQVHKI